MTFILGLLDVLEFLNQEAHLPSESRGQTLGAGVAEDSPAWGRARKPLFSVALGSCHFLKRTCLCVCEQLPLYFSNCKNKKCKALLNVLL